MQPHLALFCATDVCAVLAIQIKGLPTQQPSSLLSVVSLVIMAVITTFAVDRRRCTHAAAKVCSNNTMGMLCSGTSPSQPSIPQGLGTLPNGQLAGDSSSSGSAGSSNSGSSQGWFGSWFSGGDNSSAPKVLTGLLQCVMQKLIRSHGRLSTLCSCNPAL